MSTHTLQPLIWLARRCTSSWLIGTRARLIVFETPCSAASAPSTAKAGLVIRAVINMGSRLLSHRLVDVGQALDGPDREDVTDGRIRGTPPSSAGRGDADPRLAGGGRRRAPGGVDPHRSRGHERGRQRRRVADDGRLARVPDDARRAQAPPRGGAGGRAPTRPTRHPARRHRPDPEGEALAADAVGAALMVVLETLQPAERLAFVLHDLFAVPFED